MKTKILTIVLVLISFLTSCTPSCKEYKSYGNGYSTNDTLFIECTNMSQEAVNDIVNKRVSGYLFTYKVYYPINVESIEDKPVKWPIIIVKDNAILHHTVDTIPLYGFVNTDSLIVKWSTSFYKSAKKYGFDY